MKTKQKRKKLLQSNVRIHLKKALVPHKGNHYRPHLVRLHGITAVLVVAVLMQVAYGFVSSGRLEVLGRVSNISATDLLADTNAERAKSSLPALKVNDETVVSAFPLLYSNIAKCYEDIGDTGKAKKNHELAASFKDKPSDTGSFYHGTKADLQIGDLLTAGGKSNYKTEVILNHIYFTASVNGAGLAAALAKGDGRERVYIVEPTGSFENDPNVTNKKFPGNPTR